LEVKSGTNTAIFEDGGFGRSNNPTSHGVTEIRVQRGQDAVGTVVSVGTARADEVRRKKLISHIRRMAASATNPEDVHQQMDEASRSDTDGFSYFRLNAPGSLDVKLDEWQPKSGIKTLRKMRESFLEWKQQPENERLLRHCASELVHRRRLRTQNADRWEHFATGAVYRCPVRGCVENDLKGQATWRDHLRLGHNWEPEDIDDQLEGSCRHRWRYRRPPEIAHGGVRVV